MTRDLIPLLLTLSLASMPAAETETARLAGHIQRIAPHEELRDGAGEDAAPVF